MKLYVQHQEQYSRGELLLRTFFGLFYIGIPHLFVLTFISIGASFMSFLAFFVCLFGKPFPRAWFDFIVNMYRWQLRVNASLYNLVDGYPPFGMDGDWDKTKLDIEYPDSFPPGRVLLVVFLGGFYAALPHIIALYGRLIASAVVAFVAWWAVLFTGRYPERMHAFNVGTLRWSQRLAFYLLFMSFEYPPFSGKE